MCATVRGSSMNHDYISSHQLEKEKSLENVKLNFNRLVFGTHYAFRQKQENRSACTPVTFVKGKYCTDKFYI